MLHGWQFKKYERLVLVVFKLPWILKDQNPWKVFALLASCSINYELIAFLQKIFLKVLFSFSSFIPVRDLNLLMGILLFLVQNCSSTGEIALLMSVHAVAEESGNDLTSATTNVCFGIWRENLKDALFKIPITAIKFL